MSTRATIRTQFYQTISEDESDSHITTSEANGYIDQALPLIAPAISYPRKYDTGTQITAGTRDYAVASDFISLVSAYFGDADNLSGDVLPLEITREEVLKYKFPSWLDNSTSARGRPHTVILKDRSTLRLFPTPDSASGATGKKLYTIYVYKPVALSSDSSEPDFPEIFHDSIQFYAAHLAYLGKLDNANHAVLMLKKFDDYIARVGPIAVKESPELLRLQWGHKDE